MEDIIQILFYIAVVAIAVISRITNKKEEPETPSPKEVLEDVFPNVGTEQEALMEKPSAKPVYQEIVVPLQTFKQARRTSPPQTEIPDTPSPDPQKPASPIRINTREEARRAFIHSEIFNRKY